MMRSGVSGDSSLQPVYLFADSELLFWKQGSKPFIESLRGLLGDDVPKAAYIGASNGDAEEFHSIFESAMDGIGLTTRMIRSSFPEGDRQYLREARVILLAGGDIERGWKVFVETGMKDDILYSYQNGAVLIGISAGAVQLGLHAVVERGESSHQLIDSLKVVPFVIDVHDELRNWSRLESTIRLLEGMTVGIGIPKGGGLTYHSDRTLEAVRRPLYEFSVENGTLKHSLLMPSETP